ncbi:MAG: hypothetical protein ACOVK9_06610 [Bacteroidia bacterium]
MKNEINIFNKIAEAKSFEKNNCYVSLSEEEKKSIEKGLSNADNGKLNPHSEAIKIYNKYL